MRICLDHPYTTDEIAAITGGSTHGNYATSTHLTTDSREVQPGDLFVALRGDRYNGNSFLHAAAANGAAILLGETSACTVRVEDSMRALRALAQHARDRIHPTVITITGSVGKTTTKNMIAAVLKNTYRTHKTLGNRNNELGLCLTLLSMPSDTEVLVAELGMNHIGEIATLSHLAKPSMVVITNIGHAHIGNLGSREQIARAKCEILAGCRQDTLCFIPANEPLIEKKIPPSFPLIRIGKGGECDHTAISIGTNGIETDFICQGTHFPNVGIAGFGSHLADCAAFALAIAQALNVPQMEIRAALSTAENDSMRQQLIEVNGITVLVDCYNASPESARAACDTLCTLAKQRGSRRLALLGDMLELGDRTRPLHEALGEYVANCGIDYLFTFGAAAESIATGARHAGMPDVRICGNPSPADHAESARQINGVLKKGDVLLLKASRALAAERIVALLKTEC